MSDPWIERLKIIKEIVVIVVTAITAMLAGWNVKQVQDVQATQQVNSARLEETQKSVDTVVKMGAAAALK